MRLKLAIFLAGVMALCASSTSAMSGHLTLWHGINTSGGTFDKTPFAADFAASGDYVSGGLTLSKRVHHNPAGSTGSTQPLQVTQDSIEAFVGWPLAPIQLTAGFRTTDDTTLGYKANGDAFVVAHEGSMLPTVGVRVHEKLNSVTLGLRADTSQLGLSAQVGASVYWGRFGLSVGYHQSPLDDWFSGVTIGASARF